MLNFLITVVNCMGMWRLIFKSWFVLWMEERTEKLLASNVLAMVDVMFHKPTCFLFWEMTIYVIWQHFWCPNVATQIIYFDHVSKSNVKGYFNAWCASVSFSTCPQHLRLPLTSRSLFHYNFVMLPSTWNLFHYDLVEWPVWSSGCWMYSTSPWASVLDKVILLSFSACSGSFVCCFIQFFIFLLLLFLIWKMLFQCSV